jgi:hypothetical protein
MEFIRSHETIGLSGLMFKAASGREPSKVETKVEDGEFINPLTLQLSSWRVGLNKRIDLDDDPSLKPIYDVLYNWVRIKVDLDQQNKGNQCKK